MTIHGPQENWQFKTLRKKYPNISLLSLLYPSKEPREGSHRHVGNYLKNFACVRSHRVSGADTDYQKLQKKPDDFLLSYSYGDIDKITKYITIPQRYVVGWIRKHELLGDLSRYERPLATGDLNLFFHIPLIEIKYALWDLTNPSAGWTLIGWEMHSKIEDFEDFSHWKM